MSALRIGPKIYAQKIDAYKNKSRVYDGNEFRIICLK